MAKKKKSGYKSYKTPSKPKPKPKAKPLPKAKTETPKNVRRIKVGPGKYEERPI